MLRTLSFLWAI
jgi:MFS transporter, OFA family, oxalate/formate antiporter